MGSREKFLRINFQWLFIQQHQGRPVSFSACRIHPAQFNGCTFEDTSFDHSDFVLANLSDCKFIRCSFQNAEWRDSEFRDVIFRQCIFRNITTSLTRFVDCSFDDASSANFVGPSKRFSVFSRTHFRLLPNQLEFLRTNFGLASRVPCVTSAHQTDPLFELSLQYYRGTLTARGFHQHLAEALDVLTSATNNPQLLRMRYLCGVCRSLADEEFLSVFALQLLNDTISTKASDLRDRHQALEVMGLALGLRVAIRDRVTSVAQEMATVPDILAPQQWIEMEFENSYQRSSIADYLDLMACYCRIPTSDIQIQTLRTGSTLVDVLVATGAYVTDVFRFVKFSLSLAAVTVSQLGKFKKQCDQLVKSTKGTSRTRKSAQVRGRNANAGKRIRSSPSSEEFSKHLLDVKSDAARAIEVFVDTANERVLVLDGRVRVTITLR